MNRSKRKPTLEDVLELSGIDVLHPGGLEITRRIGEIADMRSKKVLDVACGRGTLPAYYARTFGARVVGIDFSPEMIRSSIEKARQEGVEALTEFRVADSLNIPFEDDSFDVVVNECAVGLTSDPQRCLNEMARVAKCNTPVVLHESTWLKPIPEWQRTEMAERIGTVPYTLLEWKAMMERAGLRDLWSEDWSGPENMLKIRADRKPRGPNDIFSAWELLTIIFPRVVSRYGMAAMVQLYDSARRVTPLYSDGRLGYFLLRGWKK